MQTTPSTVDTLEAATRPIEEAPGRFILDVPDGWQQGRGAYGGLTLASLVRAIEAHANDATRSLRSLTAALPAALLTGRAEVMVETLRAGAGQTTLSAKLVQAGEVRAHATAILAKPRAPDAETFCELEAPNIRPFHELPVLAIDAIAVRFTQHFEFRSDGPLPFTGQPRAAVEGSIRARRVSCERHAGAMSRGALLTALADAWWPATFYRMTAGRPVGTVAFTLQVVGGDDDRPPFDPRSPLVYRGRTWTQSAGWFVEQRELWSAGADGTAPPQLVALNQQTFAII